MDKDFYKKIIAPMAEFAPLPVESAFNHGNWMLSENYQQDYERAMANVNVLTGQQARLYHGGTEVREAISDFIENNHLEKDFELEEIFMDKDFIDSHFDLFTGYSHYAELEPYVGSIQEYLNHEQAQHNKTKAIYPDIADFNKENCAAYVLAEVFYAKSNGAPEEKIAYALDNLNSGDFNKSTFDTILRATSNDVPLESLDKFKGKDSFAVDAVLSYGQNCTEEQQRISLTANDFVVTSSLLNAMKSNSITNDQARAIAEAMNSIEDSRGNKNAYFDSMYYAEDLINTVAAKNTDPDVVRVFGRLVAESPNYGNPAVELDRASDELAKIKAGTDKSVPVEFPDDKDRYKDAVRLIYGVRSQPEKKNVLPPIFNQVSNTVFRTGRCSEKQLETLKNSSKVWVPKQQQQKPDKTIEKNNDIDR